MCGKFLSGLLLATAFCGAAMAGEPLKVSKFYSLYYKAATPVNTLLASPAWKNIDPSSGYSTYYGRYWDNGWTNNNQFNGHLYDVTTLAGTGKIHLRGRFYGAMPIVVFFQDKALTIFVANGVKKGTIEDGAMYDFYENVPAGAAYAYVQQSRTGHDSPFMEMVVESDTLEIKKKVVLVGDSLTQMAGYAEELMNLVKQIAPEYDVWNFGIGGEKTNEICSRMGAFQMSLTPADTYLSTDAPTGRKYFTLPADIIPVCIGASSISNSWNDAKLALLLQTAIISDCDPGFVWIDGIKCQLTLSGGLYYLQRVIADTKVHKVFFNTQMIPVNSINITPDDIVVINIGQNGGWVDTNDLVAQYQRTIDHLGTKKYIVISTHYAQNSDITKVNYVDNRTVQENALKKAFGAKYINMREYFCTQALYDALETGYWSNGAYPTGVVDEVHPTATDTAYMKAGLYAPMWRTNPNNPADIIHLSRRTYAIYYQKVFKSINELGYLR